jgi:predicted negative regulator of RcsB-dependent stress response
MEVGSPEWIEASLARLDELEQERAKHEAAVEAVNEPFALRQHNAEIERLSAEIKTLYAQLEEIAEDDEDDEDVEQDDDESPASTQGDDELSAPHFSAMSGDADDRPAFSVPVSAPPPSAPDNPFGSPAASPAGAGFGASAPATFDDDLKPKGGGSKWVFLVVVLLGAGGVGGYFAWQNMQANKPAPTGPSEPGQVIQAAEVPDDTEAPNAAKSGDATISPNANPSSGSGGGDGGSSKKKKEEKKTKPIVLKGGDGPL